jgi:alkylation response protein AidB-like acyl-CoA dehydrogenase
MVVGSARATGSQLDSELCSSACAWRARAAEFARDVVLPLAELIDRTGDASAAQRALPLRDFLAQAHREGFTRLSDRVEHGGLGLPRPIEFLVLEQLAAADAGLAMLLIGAPLPFRWAAELRPGRLARELTIPYLRGEQPDWSGCWTAAAQPPLRVTPSPGGWILSGRVGSVVGAAVATHAAVGCVWFAGRASVTAFAIIGLERPGITRRHQRGELGLLARCRGELAFEDVFVSDEELAFPARPRVGWSAGAIALDHLIGAVAAVGIARATYQAAARFVSERAYAGAPTRAQRKAEGVLPRLHSELDAARRLTRTAHLQRGLIAAPIDPSAVEQATVARLRATDAALEIVEAAGELLSPATGSEGTVEFLDGSTFWIEKLRRDARSLGRAEPGSSQALTESSHSLAGDSALAMVTPDR